MKKKEVSVDERKKLLTLFMLFFPSILIVLVPEMLIWWMPIVFKFLLLFYQFIILKNFIDKYYGDYI